MFKKIIIPTMVFVGMSLMAFYTARTENLTKLEDEIKTETYAPTMVLELFTSQGCSSCPPADALLEKMKKQYPNEIYALSYHVDYWNYIGWEDPFSKSVYTKKQRDYNRKFKYRSNYTPQLVINGKEHFVGSNQAKMYSMINEYRTKRYSNGLNLVVKETQRNSIAFEYEVMGDLKDQQLRVVLVLDERTTEVRRGENRNRALRNSNIVVAEKYISPKAKHGAASISIPEVVLSNDNLTLMALIEEPNLDITAAAQVKISR